MSKAVVSLLLFFVFSSASLPVTLAFHGPRSDSPAVLQTGEDGTEIDHDDESLSCGVDSEVALIRDKFNHEGFVVLRNFFSDDKNPAAMDEQNDKLKSLLEDDWYNFSNVYWNRIFQELHKRGHISQPNHVMNHEYVMGKLREPGFKEIVHRNPGRYEISLSSAAKTKNADPVGDSKSEAISLLYHDMPSLQPIIDKLEPVILSILRQHPNYKAEDDKKYNLLQSMLISAPDSRIQQFHWDTKHLNDEEEDRDEHLPAHMINVFIPLINVTTYDLGPTELVPQSHFETRWLRNPKTRAKGKPLKPSVTPLMNVGDVLMFDFRILHRGLANTYAGNINRPLLVLAFGIPSFHDTDNWPGPSIFD